MVQHRSALPDFLSASPAMTRIKEISTRIADKDVPVLILGESGVGKEVVARFIHARSNRRDEPFVKINCAAVPHDLLESELFGYERGAFTGASQRKTGLFEAAQGGTIFLDEIAELPCLLQPKLLHVLQDREFSRVGGKSTVVVDARIIATTNRLLEKSVANGEFREDLYYRLAVIKIEIPPLRKRKEDIPILTEHFLRKYSQHFGVDSKDLPYDLLDAFARYDWPGNVRQLKNVVQRYLILSDIDLALSEVKPVASSDLEAPREDAESPSLLEIGAVAAERAEKQAVLQALDETNWNKKAAACRLSVSYKTLLNKLQRWDVRRREDLSQSSEGSQDDKVMVQ